MPAPASNSRCEPAVPVELVPVCHAGGRGFESRRSRKRACKWAYHVVGLDSKSKPTTQTLSRGERKRAKTGRKRDYATPVPSRFTRRSARQRSQRATTQNGRRSH